MPRFNELLRKIFPMYTIGYLGIDYVSAETRQVHLNLVMQVPLFQSGVLCLFAGLKYLHAHDNSSTTGQ
jgi:hypothetical protein